MAIIEFLLFVLTATHLISPRGARVLAVFLAQLLPSAAGITRRAAHPVITRNSGKISERQHTVSLGGSFGTGFSKSHRICIYDFGPNTTLPSLTNLQICRAEHR
ncbi:hypothetical protein ABZP36_025536 [Zizania latifolia]